MSLFGVPARPLSFPAEGMRHDGLLYRLPTTEDLGTLAPAFQDGEIAGGANLPPFSLDELGAVLAGLGQILEQGVMIPLVVADAETGQIQGGGNLHHFDWERDQAEVGYWLFEYARGRGTGTRTARFLAEYAFSLGLGRVEARVNAGNPSSERVLERAGFSREGVIRSLLLRDGRRLDQTLYSLLPGE